ncbi:helix-turn-helix domain-containing protein [Parachryseolinea silvisoli]|uniref:helix-turn-helix domain-containing protein n=1 Tax=Parachryseolinea silvisoli TaxID=2873601 RepID=UPI0022657E6E|nr:helix-turn-helix transcriptional regulator [Parachryseolinea silvisoli]MCD9015251.1 helix-turn-helix domain-containing protein [Parachryseolinea silvisoli]
MSTKNNRILNVKHRFEEKIRIVGARIRTIREKKELYQKPVADEALISVNSLSLIENGKLNPSIGTLFALAEALDAEVEDFFKDTSLDRKRSKVDKRQ